MNIIVKNNLMKDFADWLKTNREREKLSLRELVDKIDHICSDAFLSQLENRRYIGKKGEPMRPDKQIVIALANVFHQDVNEALKLARHAPLSESPNTEAAAEVIRIEDIGDFRIRSKQKLTDKGKTQLETAIRMAWTMVEKEEPAESGNGKARKLGNIPFNKREQGTGTK